MRLLFRNSKNQSYFLHIYIAALLVAFQYYFVTYINSTFLNQYFSTKAVSWLYVFGSLLNIIIFFNSAKILRRIGNYAFTLCIAGLDIILLVLLAFSKNIWLLVPVFIIHAAVYPTLVFNLDIFTKSATEDKKTGSVRGMFLTLLSFAALISPAIVGHWVDKKAFTTIYLISAGFLTAFTLVIAFFFQRFEDPNYKTIKPFVLLKEILAPENKKIKNIVMANFFLQFFYSFMIVYLPIYLSKYIGFSFTEIGFIISFSILSFVIFEFPIGELADRFSKEKSILIASFILMIASVLFIPHLSSAHIVYWIILLFIARLGACAVEVSSESYFFKHIHSENSEFISFWRMNIPLAFMAGPTVGSVTLLFFPLKNIFYVLAIALCIGLFIAIKLKNIPTKS